MTFSEGVRRCVLWLGVFALPLPVLAQNSSTDSQNLRALLEEVWQLRHDLQVTIVAAQRIQIVLYRLQSQEAVVASAGRLVEEAQRHLDELAAERQRLAAEMQRVDEFRKKSQDAHEVKMIEEEGLPEMKRHDDRLAGEEGRWRSRASEAEAQLRTEQAKLDGLRASLDQLEQSLSKWPTGDIGGK